MNDRLGKRRKARLLLGTWLGLLALTAASYAIAESQLATQTSTALPLLGLAACKALLIAWIFMELMHAPRVWAFAMSGFLLFQAALLAMLSS